MRGRSAETVESAISKQSASGAYYGLCLPFLPRAPSNRCEAAARESRTATSGLILEFSLSTSAALTCSAAAPRRVKAPFLPGGNKNRYSRRHIRFRPGTAADPEALCGAWLPFARRGSHDPGRNSRVLTDWPPGSRMLSKPVNWTGPPCHFFKLHRF